MATEIQGERVITGQGGALYPFIKSTVLTAEEVFSGRFRLQLPWFQRAYAWSDKHTGRLLTDLLEAKSGKMRRYSLGHIFLAKPGPAPHASIIDGHQRSMSLTILFALLRDRITDAEMRDRLHGLIEAPDGSGFRFSMQPGVQDFVAAHVQRPMATEIEPDGDIMDLSESERNILANRNHLRGLLIEQVEPQSELLDLASFLLERCYFIVDEVEDEEEAWDLLTTEEETGLGFHSSERSKISIISAMPRAEQEEASRIYERAQSLLGADDMARLLGHIRTLKARRRTTKPIEKEILQRFKINQSGMAFLKDELLPRAETMSMINRREVGTGAERTEISRSIDTLFWLDHQLWMPAALHWLAVMAPEHPHTQRFFARLDRLAYVLKIAGVDPTDQEQRFLKLLSEIDNEHAVDAMPRLAIEPDLRAAALENLRHRTFYSKRFHALVLRRISWNVDPARDPGPIDSKTVTVEHVLPRKPPKDREWIREFPTAAVVADYCNRLGNLSFLALEENNVAGTSDYVVKRIILAGASPRFVLAEHAAREQTWTRETIAARTEDMIAILLAPWQLSP